MDSRTTTFLDDDANLFTVAVPRGSPPGDEEADHSFIADHWLDLAAASYMGFKRLGIGAVVVQERPSQSDVVGLDAHALGYAPADGAWLDDRDDLPLAWLDQQFQTYDPNAASLLLFVDGIAPVRVYRVEGHPPPPEAFEAARSSMN